MPHLVMDYTSNLASFDAAAVLYALNRALAASGEFAEADIKSRAQRLDCHLVGVENGDRAFVHVRLALLAGRSAATKQALAESLLAALQCSAASCGIGDAQCCVEILDIDRGCYVRN